MLAHRPSNNLGGGLAEFVDYDVHFKQCLHLLKFVNSYTFKCLNWLVGVLLVESIWIVAQMQSHTAEQTEIIDVWSAMVVFLQSNDGFVTFHIGGQVDAEATYGVLQDAIDEYCRIRYKFDHPVRVWSLTQSPLQDIRILYPFQEILESVSDHARFVEVSTTAVTRAVIISVSTRCPISKNEAIRNVNFKRRRLSCEKMTNFQPSDIRCSQSDVVA